MQITSNKEENLLGIYSSIFTETGNNNSNIIYNTNTNIKKTNNINKKLKLSWHNLTIENSILNQNKNQNNNNKKNKIFEKNNNNNNNINNNNEIDNYSNKKMLKNISGQIYSGEALAIIGSSGAGKTTLLNFLSKTEKNKNLNYKGEIFINNQTATNEIMESISAYVKQDDILEASMTPLEVLLFTAKLKLANLTNEDIEIKVDDMINKLNLNNAKTIRIGNELIKGISGGERKRTSIALELIGDPNIIFLDEPTTGLDSFNAFEVVKNICELAKKDNKLIIFTIHNPQSEVFGLLDKLCILADGNTVFFGDTKDSLNCFEKIFHIPCPINYNPFEHFIEVTSLDSEFLKKNNKKFYKENKYYNKNDYTNSNNDIDNDNEDQLNKTEFDFEFNNLEAYSLFMKILSEKFEKNKHIYNNNNDSRNKDNILENENKNENENNIELDLYDFTENKNKIKRCFFYEFKILFGRNIINSYRKKKILAIKLIQNFITSILQALLFASLSSNITGIRDRTGLIFLCIKACIFGTANSSLFVFSEQKKIYDRERSNNLYSISAYFLAKLFSEIPLIMMSVNSLLTLTYLISDFNDTFSWKYYLFNLILQLSALCGLSYSIFFGSLINNIEILGIINILFLWPQMILSGYFSSSENITFFMKPIEIVSPFKYTFQALTQIEFGNIQPLNCFNNNDYLNDNNDNEFQCDPLSGLFKFKETLSFNLFLIFLIAFIYFLSAYFVLLIKEIRRRK
jgi:ABC-type multidrug transport system ATPase subunit